MSAGLGDIQKNLQDAMRDAFNRQILVLNRFAQEQRKGHYEPDEELLARFRDFEKRYDAIVTEGLEADFLFADYDGYVTNEPRGTWVYDETEEEHAQRLKRAECEIGSGGHVVFPVAKGPKP